jgi:large subunit ribosomal protein L10
MPKAREDKHSEAADLSEKLKRSKAAVITSQTNVTVKDIEGLRKELRANDAELQTIKKTLLTRALKDNDITLDLSGFAGTAAVVFSYSDATTGARLVKNFMKDHETMNVVSGIMDAAVISREQVIALAMLPGRQELLATVVRTLYAPVTGFVRTLNGTLEGFVHVLSAVQEAKAKAS